MYKIPNRTVTTLDVNTSVEGETIEQQIERLVNNGEVIGDEKEMIYTKPSLGVVYGTDIRGDKQEKAIEMTEKVTKDVMRRRELNTLNEKKKSEEMLKKEQNNDNKSEEIKGEK